MELDMIIKKTVVKDVYVIEGYSSEYASLNKARDAAVELAVAEFVDSFYFRGITREELIKEIFIDIEHLELLLEQARVTAED
tara:strand:- start:1139 stop:1384 length:246 start_codon:yes stop_codon:yes gene_type:complete